MRSLLHFQRKGDEGMKVMDYVMDDHVAVLTMGKGENRLNPDFISEFLSVLDEIEKEPAGKALVVTSAHEKIFSNGIDLDWLLPLVQKGDREKSQDFFYRMNLLFKRILLYPMPTVAAISGHAFAGGAILACAFDFRFMRSDRGFFCFPEVDLGIPFLPGMIALLKKAIPFYKLEELQYTGKRATAEECAAHHILLKALPMERMLAESIAFAKGFNKGREIIAEMKQRMHREIIRIMDEEDPPVIESGTFHV
jgi:Delta3-Delta2-enoyl-CoA isomerase